MYGINKNIVKRGMRITCHFLYITYFAHGINTALALSIILYKLNIKNSVFSSPSGSKHEYTIQLGLYAMILCDRTHD
jgi:hypothetical protein